MNKLFSVIFTIVVCSQIGLSQKTESLRTSLAEAQREAAEMKRGYTSSAMLAPADFSDTASFGRNAKFLGSLYAGTVYIYRSCDPQILLDEIGLELAADDHCLVHNSTTPLNTTSVFDPVWQITIPANTVDNVIYPMLNHTAGLDA